MGILLWLASGTAVWALARIVPPGRRPGWLAELVLSVLTALLLGVAATAMDFGGWQEPDWRAALFAGVGAFGAIGIRRALSARP